MAAPLDLNGRLVGPGHAVLIVAELSANHGQDIEEAVRIVRAARDAGADAVKLQTYTADTLTIRCDAPPFLIGPGTPWEGRTLHELYAEAYTPWEWHARLRREAEAIGLIFFSTPFDTTAVEFLEELKVPVHKVASFELVDQALLRRIGETGKPVIMSTGMANRDEIAEAVGTLRQAGTRQLALLKCTSAYPAEPEEMNLAAMPRLAEIFGVVTGISDHTLGLTVPVVAVALGASIIEKHLTLSRTRPGPDSSFSLEPAEFRAMVEAVRTAERSLGAGGFDGSPREEASRAFRRSLFVVEDVKAGEAFTARNVRSIRPAHGLPPRHLLEVLGQRASRDVARGTPLSWDLVAPP